MNERLDARGPAVIAVSGVKNSGKTTFLARLIPLLRERGLRVAVVKHDGHEFEPDVPGTDSFRLRAAGAQAVAVYSDGRFMLVREQPGTTAEDLIALFPDMDLVLLEGAKYSPYPKLELVRGAVSRGPVCDPATLLALCTDTDCRVEGVLRLALNDYEAAARRIDGYLRGGR